MDEVEKIAKLLVEIRADDPRNELILHPQSTRKRSKQPLNEAMGSTMKKPNLQDPPTETSGHIVTSAQTMELNPLRDPPAPSMGMQADLSSQTEGMDLINLTDSLAFWERSAISYKPAVDGIMFDKLLAEGTQCQLMALRYSNVQQSLVKRLAFELKGARSALKQVEESLAESERNLREEEEARNSEKDRLVKEKEELFNALESMKEERDRVFNALESMKEERDRAQEAASEAKDKAVAEFKASEAYKSELNRAKREGADLFFWICMKKVKEQFSDKRKEKGAKKSKATPSSSQPPASSS